MLWSPVVIVLLNNTCILTLPSNYKRLYFSNIPLVFMCTTNIVWTLMEENIKEAEKYVIQQLHIWNIAPHQLSTA